MLKRSGQTSDEEMKALRFDGAEGLVAGKTSRVTHIMRCVVQRGCLYVTRNCNNTQADKSGKNNCHHIGTNEALSLICNLD